MSKKVPFLTAKQAIALFEKNGGIMVGTEPLSGEECRDRGRGLVNGFDEQGIGSPTIYMVGKLDGKSRGHITDPDCLLVAAPDESGEHKIWSYLLDDRVASFLPGLLSLDDAGAGDYKSVLSGIKERLLGPVSSTPPGHVNSNIYFPKLDEFGILPGACSAISQKFAEIKARSEAIGQKLYHHPGG